jgi:hypothetical protein
MIRELHDKLGTHVIYDFLECHTGDMEIFDMDSRYINKKIIPH